MSHPLTRLESMRGDGSRNVKLATEPESIDGKLHRLTAAIAGGANFDALLAAIGERERKRARLRRELASLDETIRAVEIDRKQIETQLRARLDEWRTLLRRRRR